jgi:hypothetical protein
MSTQSILPNKKPLQVVFKKNVLTSDQPEKRQKIEFNHPKIPPKIVFIKTPRINIPVEKIASDRAKKRPRLVLKQNVAQSETRRKIDNVELEEVKTCSCKNHRWSDSPYQKHEVPIRLFVNSVHNYGQIYKYCIDCRKYGTKNKKKWKKNLSTVPQNHFRCSVCAVVSNISLIAKKSNGDNSKSTCQRCFDHSKRHITNLSKNIHLMQLQRILETGQSCVVLKTIDLKPTDDNPWFIRRIPIIDEGVTFEGKEYYHMDFVRLFEDQLEFRHLENDHIPQDEWEKRWPQNVYPTKKWTEKEDNVYNIKTIIGQKIEFSKCQLVSKLGHDIVTENRQNSASSYTTSSRKKKEWVDDYKRKTKGYCALCKQYHVNVPLRFLHFDHTNINKKTDTIARMVHDPTITLQTLVEEAELHCRLLCAHCHKLHTKNQFASGILHDKARQTIAQKEQNNPPLQ